MDIVIAGAGIAGLTTALCLAKTGHEVRLLESTNDFQDIGAGIQCGANALVVMEYLGLLTQLIEIGVAPKTVEFRDYKTGHGLHSMPLGEPYKEKYGAPYLHLHRSDLHRVLLEAFNRKHPGQISTGSRVDSYFETKDRVQINLANGELLKAQLLIGADGINSAVRQKISDSTLPKFTGNVAWRGVVPVERLGVDWMDTVVSNFVGPDKHMVLYYLRNKKLANFVGVVENRTWVNNSWSAKAPWEELSNDFKGWHPTVRDIINATEKDQCFRWALYNHQPLQTWSSKRVTLVGDAAHATLPFMASGAAMAIEDGRVLQRAIDQVSNLQEGLELYQRNRIRRTSKIQTMSSRAGGLYHIKSDLMRKAAFAAIKRLGTRQEAFLPEYDANTVKLT